MVLKDRIAKQKFRVTFERHRPLAWVRNRFADCKRRVQLEDTSDGQPGGLPAAG
ncbi:MAG TPA: hypothetical protein VF748_04475 [Candidatus Acidoferrum sp.]